MILYATGDEWLQLSNGSLQTVPAYPDLRENAIVLWHPPTGISGVAALEGNTRHAAALIERQLKAEGGIDGVTKLFVDHIRPIGRGYQALYTAVELGEWQRMLAWSEAQPNHCLIYSSTRLLWNATSPQIAAVLHSANQLRFIGLIQGQIVHINTLAFGDSENDVALAVRSLGDRVREELTRQRSGATPQTIQVQWFSVFLPEVPVAQSTLVEAGDERESEDMAGRELRLQDVFTKASGLAVTTSQGHTPEGRPAELVIDSLVALGRLGRIRDALNATPAKALFLAHRFLPGCVIGNMVLALGLFSVSATSIVQNRHSGETVQALHAQEQIVRQRLAGLKASPELSPEFDRQLALLSDLQKFEGSPDLVGVLMALKAASSYDVHILGVRLEEASTGTNASNKAGVDKMPPTKSHALTIDGMLTGNGSVSDSLILSGFVRSLHEHGYQAEATETRGATALGTSSRLFSYRLMPAQKLPTGRP